MKRLARENSESKADSMDSCHVILKTHHVIKKQPLGLAHKDGGKLSSDLLPKFLCCAPGR
jgi:hypothetical protein